MKVLEPFSSSSRRQKLEDMSNPKAMGALRAFFEAFRLLRTNLKPMVSSMLLVLVPCDLLSSLAQRYLPPLLVLDGNLLLHETVASPPSKAEIQPVSTIISSLSEVVMVYSSIMACSGSKPSPDALFRRAGKTWWRPAITVLYARLFRLLFSLLTMAIAANKVEVQLVSSIILGLSVVVLVSWFIMACLGNKPSGDASSRRAGETWWRPAIAVLYAGLSLLLASLVPLVPVKILGPLARMDYVPSWVLLLISFMLVSGMTACIAVSFLVERWGLVASVQEEGCHGITALGRAWGFMTERKLQVLVLTLAMFPLDMGISTVCSFVKVDRWEEMTLAMLATKSLVGALVRSLWGIYNWLVYTALYYHQKNCCNRE